MAAKSKFTISLEAEDKVTPVAKKAEDSTSKFLNTAKEAAKESGGLFGKLAATLGPVGTGLVGLGAAAVGILKIAEYGASAGKEVEKLGAASGLTAAEINKMVSASKEFESVSGRLTGAIGLLASPVTGFVSTVGEGAAAIVLDFARGIQVLGTSAKDSEKELAKLLETTATLQKREGPAVFKNTKLVETGIVFSDAESVANEKQATRDAAANALRVEAARKYQDYLNELVAMGSTSWGEIANQENARIEAEKSFAEQLAAAQREGYLAEQDRLREHNQNMVDEANAGVAARAAIFKDMGTKLENILASQTAGFVVAIASGKESLAQATQGLFSGLLTEVGTTLIQLGTAAVFSGLLASVFGTIASIPAGLAAIAAGATLVAGGALVGGSFGGGSGGGGRSASTSSAPNSRFTDDGRRRGGPFGAPADQTSMGGGLTVVIQSAFPPSRAHAAEIVDSLAPALSDARRRGRLK